MITGIDPWSPAIGSVWEGTATGRTATVVRAEPSLDEQHGGFVWLKFADGGTDAIAMDGLRAWWREVRP